MNILLNAVGLLAVIMLGAGLVALITAISIAATPWREGDLDADFDSHSRDRFTGLRRRIYLHSRERTRARYQRNDDAAAAHHATLATQVENG